MSREILQVSTTVGSRDEAVALARDLVERRLAACVQVVGPVESSFRWKGSTEAAQEWVCVAKTTHAGVEALTTAIRAAHTYELPEILETRVVATDEYARWVADAVLPEGPY